jgi:hypothetical protein
MKELHLGEGDMECYIVTFRRMSMMDLHYNLDDEDSTNDAVEVASTGKKVAGMTNSSSSLNGCDSSSVVSSVHYTVMEDRMT